MLKKNKKTSKLHKSQQIKVSKSNISCLNTAYPSGHQHKDFMAAGIIFHNPYTVRGVHGCSCKTIPGCAQLYQLQ